LGGVWKIAHRRRDLSQSNRRDVLSTLIGFTLVYGALMAADIYLLAKYAKAGPEPAQASRPLEEQAYWE